MAKKEPSISVKEATTPSLTYLSVGDDYGMPGYNGGTEHVRYESVRAGQTEGLGLLQVEGTPAVRRKEVLRKEVRRNDISRKSVPGRGDGNGSL